MLLTVMSAVSTSKDLLGIWDRERDRASESDFVSWRSLFSDGNCFLSWSVICLALSNAAGLCLERLESSDASSSTIEDTRVLSCDDFELFDEDLEF